MNPSAVSDVLSRLPTAQFGTVRRAVPIRVGLSGASVYDLGTDTGEYIVRVQHDPPLDWATQLHVQRLASQGGVAPGLLFADRAARLTVMDKVTGPSFVAALRASPEVALDRLLESIQRLHALPLDGVPEADPLAYARGCWAQQVQRPGFPAWALPLADRLAECAHLTASDPRRVLSHNDLNPSNILWDGQRVWLIDWDACGASHPYYDLATVATFLDLPAATARALLARLDPGKADERLFVAFRRLSALLAGLLFLRLLPDLSGLPATQDGLWSLSECYLRMGQGSLDLQQPAGQAAFGLALLGAALATA